MWLSPTPLAMLLWSVRTAAVDWLRDFQGRYGIEIHIQQPTDPQVADML